MLSRSLSDCKSLLLNVMIQVSQLVSNRAAIRVAFVIGINIPIFVARLCQKNYKVVRTFSSDNVELFFFLFLSYEPRLLFFAHYILFGGQNWKMFNLKQKTEDKKPNSRNGCFIAIWQRVIVTNILFFHLRTTDWDDPAKVDLRLEGGAVIGLPSISSIFQKPVQTIFTICLWIFPRREKEHWYEEKAVQKQLPIIQFLLFCN